MSRRKVYLPPRDTRRKVYIPPRSLFLERYAPGAATKIGQIAQELSRVNPWWRSSGWSKTDPDLTETRQTGLNYRSGALDDLTSGSLYLLRGPRRVGKTVTVKQAIEDLLSAGTAPTSIVRIAADGWDAKDLRTLMQNVALPLLPEGSRRYWFIDEVSAVTGGPARQDAHRSLACTDYPAP